MLDQLLDAPAHVESASTGSTGTRQELDRNSTADRLDRQGLDNGLDSATRRSLDSSRHTTARDSHRAQMSAHKSYGQRSGLRAPWSMVDTMAACTHSQVHAIFMRWPVPPSTPPRPHHTETIAARAPSPVDPRIGRTHPADAPNTNTQDRQSTPWLYSPLDRRAEFIGSGCD